MVFVDFDQENCLKLAIPAKSEEDAKSYAEGNGEIIAVKDVTDEYKISAEKVGKALEAYGFSKMEMDIITRCLQFTGIAE